MKIPQRADRRIGASVLARVLDPLSGLLVIAIEERGAGEGHLDRRVQVAVGAEVGPIDEGGELVAGLAVETAVRLRRDLDDDTRSGTAVSSSSVTSMCQSPSVSRVLMRRTHAVTE